jgi:Icc-related predicted phosphoesterase
MKMDRRDFLKLMGMGSAVLVMGSRTAGAAAMKAGQDDFMFVQLSDTHWGFNGPAVNPDATGTLKKAIAAVNSMNVQPDFVVFTGDITHTTDDPKERRKRMAEAKDIISGLKVKDIKFLAGEHDAGLDNGEAFKEYFGNTRYTFDHKGVHFIVVDNVSDPTSSIGDVQLQWMSDELKKLDKKSRIIVLTHRPLFDLYPNWDWWTRDGAKAIDLLKPYKHVTVLYGHIHQEQHHKTGHIPHHAAKGLMFALPAPGSVPKRVPIPWDPAAPYKELGYRSVQAKAGKSELMLTEFPVQKG